MYFSKVLNKYNIYNVTTGRHISVLTMYHNGACSVFKDIPDILYYNLKISNEIKKSNNFREHVDLAHPKKILK